MPKGPTKSYLGELKEAFDSFDADGNGLLSRAEVTNMLNSLGLTLADKDLEGIFNSSAKDSKDTIEFPEFSAWITDKLDIISKDDLLEIFHLIDLDGNGVISTNELKQVLNVLHINASDEEVATFMSEADLNRNGVIDFDEFVKSEGIWNRIKLTVGATRSFYTQAEFDKLSREYDGLIRLWVPRYDEVIGITINNLPSKPSSPRVLDLGCGTGNLSTAVLERFQNAESHILDNSSKMIDFCKRRFKGKEQVHIYEQDFRISEFGECSFDHIISLLALHHLDGAGRKLLFENIYRWLKPGGVFSYSDIFSGMDSEVQESDYASWKRECFNLGATEEQWQHFMDHDKRYDHLITIKYVLECLKETGFVDIEVTWRNSLWANIVARKYNSPN